jgi:signal transduction histidine kinase
VAQTSSLRIFVPSKSQAASLHYIRLLQMSYGRSYAFRVTPACHRDSLLKGLRVSGWLILLFLSAVQLKAQDFNITNLLQLRAMATQKPSASFSFRIEGTVLWANSAQGQFVLQNASAAEKLEVELGAARVELGQVVRVEGTGTVARIGDAIRLGAKGPVVNNDGVHGMIEKSGAIFLKAGRQPFRFDWFNGVDKFGLKVEYEGPLLPRQKIPNSVLFRANSNNQGLDFKCYEGPWESLPDLTEIAAVKSGTVTNFDLSVRSRDDYVALEFIGELDVPRDGLYTFYSESDDGSLLFVGSQTVNVTTIGKSELPAPEKVAIGEAFRGNENFFWAETEGVARFVNERGTGFEIELHSGGGLMHVKVADGAGLLPAKFLNQWLRVTGVCEATWSADSQRIAGTLLVSNAKQIQFVEPPFLTELNPPANTGSNSLPLLTSAVEVHRLKREEAQRHYPVRIRGVITCVLPEDQGFTIQDSTRGLYVNDFSDSRSVAPRIGEFVEVEGVTDPGKFAPIVNVQHLRGLGTGVLPEPVRPTWDQLVNGSLDGQYVEIQGIITEVHTNSVTLLTREGRITVRLRVNDMEPESLTRFEDDVVRVRGILLATWNYVTHEVMPGELRIYGADITIDQVAPEDVFSIPGKNVEQLLLFDPQAGVFQRVKVSGQIVYARDPEYFAMDGKNGFRFVTKKSAELQVGDGVEVVGFPELSGAAPILREAVARKTTSTGLPDPKIIPAENLVRGEYDAMRVRLDARLVNLRETRSEQILEMQSGVRNFIARLTGAHEDVRSIPIGSQLELTGVYSAQGGNRAIGQEIASFELLLNSPMDIRVLARPPWWTLKRLLIILGALAIVLAGTVLWITQLHRQVEERTVELEAQIEARQRVENLRAMEQERARVAQDLHDELGSDLTEISMLIARTRANATPDEKRGRYLEQIGGKARQMVTALDEIVWAMNPRHDSLESIVSYFCLYAEKFLGLGNIAWKLERGSDLPDLAMDSRHRHQLFLAFKEALTNVVRHSQATEVRLGFALQDGHVQLSVADNGRGFPAGAPSEDMDGVENMRSRIVKLGGRFEIVSEAQRGTAVKFYVPVK